MIEQELERIAVALESLDVKIGAVVQSMAESENSYEEAPLIVDAEVEEAPNTDVVSAAEQEGYLDEVKSSSQTSLVYTREALLVRCNELNINVPKRTRTNTLQKWVDAEEAKPDLPSPVGVLDIIVPGNHTPTQPVVQTEVGPATYTRDEVRKALIDLCKRKNNDTELIRGILNEYGAASVSELDESKFVDIMERLQLVDSEGR